MWGLGQCSGSFGAGLAAKPTAYRQLDCSRSPAPGRRKKGGCEAIGRSRGGLSTKLHAVVDDRGLPVRLTLTPGQAHDVTAVRHLLDRAVAHSVVVGDRSYDADSVVELL